MPNLTPRLGIKKPLGNENVTRVSFNENWDVIDAKVATVGVDGKVPMDQLPALDFVPNSQKGVANGVATLGSDGKLTAEQAASDNPIWSSLTLQNGTTVFSGRTPRYTKKGSEVVVEGEINVTSSGIVIGTLPAGYRPPTTRSFKVSQNWSATNGGATFFVNPDGTINLQTFSNVDQSISLMGIRFHTN